jgi:mono/diheme cytochrome c family protein
LRRLPRNVPRDAQKLTASLAAIILAFSGLGRATADAASASRGAYLAAAAGCDQCHTDAKNSGPPYAGGRALETPFGTVFAPNITPDRATGIGRWGLADFERAVRWGVAPDDSHYLPAFPFPFYNRLTHDDLIDLKAFLDSLLPVSRVNSAAPRSIFSAVGTRAAIMIVDEYFAGPWQPDETRDAVWNRGAYLVAAVGRCGDCHTPRNWLGAREPKRLLAGAPAGPRGKAVPNITPDAETGIGKWSENDIMTLLKDGQTPDFDFVGGAMAEIVRNTTRLVDSDRRAIAVYLRSLPPIRSEKNRE